MRAKDRSEVEQVNDKCTFDYFIIYFSYLLIVKMDTERFLVVYLETQKCWFGWWVDEVKLNFGSLETTFQRWRHFEQSKPMILSLFGANKTSQWPFKNLK